MDSLGIAIDGGRFVRVSSEVGYRAKTLRLRTLKPGQRRAKLVFCRFIDGRPIILSEKILDGLPPRPQSTLGIEIRIDHPRRFLWIVIARPESSFPREYRLRTGIGPWPWIVGSLVALILFGLLARSCVLQNLDFLESRSSPEVRTETGSETVVPFPAVDRDSSAPSPRNQETAISEINRPRDGDGEGEDVESVNPDAHAGADPVPGDEVAEQDLPILMSSEIPLETDSSELSIPIPQWRPLYFAPESADLTQEAKQALHLIAQEIPENGSVEFRGHCANYGTEQGQLSLSRGRAEAVARYLRTQGVENPFVLLGLGVSEPVTLDRESQHLNRRVEIRFTPQAP